MGRPVGSKDSKPRKRRFLKPKVRLATGPYRQYGNAVAETFEEFCEDQRVRLQNSVRPPIFVPYRENWDTAYTFMRNNDHMTRAQIYRHCDLTWKGRV